MEPGYVLLFAACCFSAVPCVAVHTRSVQWTIYTNVSRNFTWNEASRFCGERGGRLPTTNTYLSLNGIRDLVSQRLPNADARFWAGHYISVQASEDDDRKKRESDSGGTTYMWEGDCSYDHQSHTNVRPTWYWSGGGQNCLEMRLNDSRLWNCDERLPNIVCEFRAVTGQPCPYQRFLNRTIAKCASNTERCNSEGPCLDRSLPNHTIVAYNSTTEDSANDESACWERCHQSRSCTVAAWADDVSVCRLVIGAAATQLDNSAGPSVTIADRTDHSLTLRKNFPWGYIHFHLRNKTILMYDDIFNEVISPEQCWEKCRAAEREGEECTAAVWREGDVDGSPTSGQCSLMFGTSLVKLGDVSLSQRANHHVMLKECFSCNVNDSDIQFDSENIDTKADPACPCDGSRNCITTTGTIQPIPDFTLTDVASPETASTSNETTLSPDGMTTVENVWSGLTWLTETTQAGSASSGGNQSRESWTCSENTSTPATSTATNDPQPNPHQQGNTTTSEVAQPPSVQTGGEEYIPKNSTSLYRRKQNSEWASPSASQTAISIMFICLTSSMFLLLVCSDILRLKRHLLWRREIHVHDQNQS